jgi:hypothetical protein
MHRRQALRMLALTLSSLTFPVFAAPRTAGSSNPLRGLSAVTYKSPTCGCCTGYVRFLESQGVRVRVVLEEDAALERFKDSLGIPANVRSCHVTRLGGYLVEGHVPLEALVKLLRERPRIEGIALPGMPVGVPGMPGRSPAPHRVVAFVQGRVTPFLTVPST